jgi:hypothetical protein
MTDSTGYLIGTIIKGGPGSGNFGHVGRPGVVGGSGEGGGSAGTKPSNKIPEPELIFSLKNKGKHQEFGKFKGKEIDNSKGQYGYGSDITEYVSPKKSKIYVVDSAYNPGMRRGSGVNGSVRIDFYNKDDRFASDENSKLFQGMERREKERNFLFKKFGIDHKWQYKQSRGG